MKNYKTMTVGAVVAASLALITSAHAQVIYSDTLTSSPNGYIAGTNINGTTPDVTDTTGATVIGFSRGSGNPTIQATGAMTNYNGAGALSLAGTNPSSNAVYTLSANLTLGTIGGTDLDGGTTGQSPGDFSGAAGFTTRGIGLGFLSTLPTANQTNEDPFSKYFSGFALNAAGSLIFVADGVSSGTPSYSIAGFSATTPYALSFTVNSATGSLTNVTFNGVDVTSSFATASAVFGAASDAGIEFGSSSNVGGNATGYVSNLVLSSAATPEPSTWAMLLSGVLVLLGVQRFNRKNSSV